MRGTRLRLLFIALRAECGSRLKAVIDLTPQERRMVLLILSLFVGGLIARLVRLNFLVR